MATLYVVGAGGIGCAVGYVLRAAGAPVTFVEADPDKVLWGRSHGVRVDYRPACPADILRFEDWKPAAGDTVLLCTKCYDNRAVLDRLPPSVHLVPIQNGFDAELEAYCNGLEGIASFVSECHPGRTWTRITRGGKLHVGTRGQNGALSFVGRASQPVRFGEDGLGSPSYPEWVDLLRRHAPFRVEVVPDILPYKHTKLMYNAAISPLAAAAGLDNGQLLSVPLARRLFFALLRENLAILRGAGIRLGKVGPFHPETVGRILSCSPAAHALAWAFYPSLRRTYCSMSGDLPRGRTEIDNYNLHLIRLAGDRPCPLNRQVYELVRRMERERIPPALQRLEELT